MGNAYGFFEIPSVSAAIDALDIMCKTAAVELVTWEKKLGGRLVTLIIEGSISDVTQAIETAASQAIKPPAATVVIANPHEEIVRLVQKSAARLTFTNDKGKNSERNGAEDGGSKKSKSPKNKSK